MNPKNLENQSAGVGIIDRAVGRARNDAAGAESARAVLHAADINSTGLSFENQLHSGRYRFSGGVVARLKR